MAVVLLGFIPSFSSSSHAHLVDNPILWLLSSGAVSTRRFVFYRLPLFPSHPRNLLLYSSPPCKCRTCAFYAPHKYTTTTIVVGLLREVSRLSFKKTNGLGTDGRRVQKMACCDGVNLYRVHPTRRWTSANRPKRRYRPAQPSHAWALPNLVPGTAAAAITKARPTGHAP